MKYKQCLLYILYLYLSSIIIFSVFHELFHTAGFAHEQQRADRGYYVIINENKIPKYLLPNFKRIPTYHRYLYGMSFLYGKYDMCSIMHYPGGSGVSMFYF